jgi:hypothetical protein
MLIIIIELLNALWLFRIQAESWSDRILEWWEPKRERLSLSVRNSFEPITPFFRMGSKAGLTYSLKQDLSI